MSFYGFKKEIMASFGICNDISEAVELCALHGLYLKPIAKINMSVQLPTMKSPGQSISNWELMEKLKKMIKPDQFLVLKVAKTTLDLVRFEGEVENKSKMKQLVNQLDGKTIKLSGFTESLKVKATEAKSQGPSKHDWDSFFRDAKDMNELRAGERPDTIIIKDLPCRWFANNTERDIPNECVIRKVFETFGEINCMDVPSLDPYRKEMQSSNGLIQTFSFGQDFVFEAFIQFKEYMSFVKAMTSLRGMKLVFKEGEGKALTAIIKVDFDRTKHLSEKSIRKRQLERERLIRLEKEQIEKQRIEKEEEMKQKEEERRRIEEEEIEKEKKREEKLKRREERRKEREERKKKEMMERKQREEEKQMQMKIAIEERKIVIARRKLETIRMFSGLFQRLKILKQQEEVSRKERELEEERIRQVEKERQKKMEEERVKIEKEKKKKDLLEKEEVELRNRILKNIRLTEERQKEKEREELRKKLSGSSLKLKSAVVIKR